MITNYKDYLSLIKEGLIRTHSIIKYSNTLETELNSFINEKDYQLSINSKFKFTLEILNNKKDDIYKIIRNKVETNLKSSNLFNPSVLISHIELAYEKAHEKNLKGEAAEDIFISD